MYNYYEIETKIQDEFANKKHYKVQNDRLKKRSFVFSRFPLVNKHSVEMNDIRCFVYADAYSRYLSYINKNVLLGIGLNNTSKKIYDNVKNNVLSQDDPYSNLKSKSYEDLYSMDISFDSERKTESHSKEFIYFVQEAFLKLYKYNYITKHSGEFYLELASIKEELIRELNYNNMFSELKEFLNFKSGLLFNFETTINQTIDFVVEEPQYLFGLNFIAISSKYINSKDFYLESEKEYIIKSLKNKKSIGVFSGNFVINPLTGQEIPIIISNYFKEDIHLGIPSVYDKDLFFSSIFGLEFNNVINYENEKTLINSDYLNGLTLEAAREYIVDLAIKEGFASYYEDVLLDKVKISCEFYEGVSIPAYDDKIVEKQELPILIDSKNSVRVFNGKLPKYKTTNQVFTSNVTQAFLSLAARVKSRIGIVNYSSKEFIMEYSDYSKIDYCIFSNKEEYIYTLILNLITSKSLNLDTTNIFKKIYIEGNFYDSHGLELLRENNNLIDLNSILTDTGCCGLRLSMLSERIRDNYYYQHDEVTSNSKLINDFQKIYGFQTVQDFVELDYPYEELIKESTKYIEENNFPMFINTIKTFMEECYKYKKITSRQAKGLLIIFSIIAPSLCEQINKDIFNGAYPLMYDAWPI